MKLATLEKLRRWLPLPVGQDGGLGLADWANSPVGRELTGKERETSTELLSQLQGGYHFMVMGADIASPVVENHGHSHFFQLGGLHDELCQAKVNYDELPLPSECIDAVVMHHVLEFSEYPHRVLNEATRVILPGGYLLVICFNPCSLYGFYAAFMRLFSKKRLWRRHTLGKRRLLDWLKLLHMQPVACSYAGYLLPRYCRERWSDKTWFLKLTHSRFLPFGGSQLILAKKVVSRPIRTGKAAWRVLPVTKSSQQAKTSVTRRKGSTVE